MQWIEIDKAERDVLREEVKSWGGVFGDLEGMVEGRLTIADELVAAAQAVAVLNAIGWEVERNDDVYELPESPEVLGFLATARAAAADGIADQEFEREPINGPELLVERRRVAEVCDAVLGRSSANVLLVSA